MNYKLFKLSVLAAMSYFRKSLFAWLSVLGLWTVMTSIPGHVWATSVLYYDVDFSSPPHTVGQPPVTNTGIPPRDGPSSIVFGNPTVVSDFGPLSDQPLEFNSFDGTGDQVEFNIFSRFDPALPPLLPPPDLESCYIIEADIVIDAVEALFGGFTILIDRPIVQFLSFRSNGEVNVHIPGGFSDKVATFTFGSLIHLRTEMSTTWQIFLDDVLVHTSEFIIPFPGRFGVRFSGLSEGISAAIDNVVISREDNSKDIDCDGEADACDPLTISDCQAVLDCNVLNWKNEGAKTAASEQCTQITTCSGSACTKKCRTLLTIMENTTPVSERQWMVDFCNAVIPEEGFQ